MRIKYSLLSTILLMFSFGLLCQSINVDYDSISNNILKENSAKIIECGVKVQYKSKKSFDDIYQNIFTNVSSSYVIVSKEIEPSYFDITFKKDKIAYEIFASVENNITMVSATSIATDNKNETDGLKKQIEKVLYDASMDVQYFSYVKGKIITDSIKNNIELTERALVKYGGAADVDTIKLNSGFTGVARLKDNTAVNYAISENDKGTYLIIGTPIIFITY
ncbi:hypothetical protein [Clostridium folliculivorans]|uniref:Membrane protein n=1 Tax=Clostridium folliculivorans TaxID=2886038 RepID=A0A9W5XYE2_9CLOT|nr:hypothetical protein [Clostridium folliculivorans]GKU23319.1 membrane protein [Clostridium folliculivorans]GKU29436.1 membrane protein [Clostridium folliculivorans]